MNKSQLNEDFSRILMNTEMVETDEKANSMSVIEQACGGETNITGVVLGGKYTLLSQMEKSTGEADLYFS